jgi:phosphatidylglycerophosphate synthase
VDSAPRASGRTRFLANALTASRLAGAPVLAWAVLAPAPIVAGIAFALAVASDLLDGRVARRAGAASAAGGFFDHATDATFVATGLAACAGRGLVTPWLPALVALAFVQYTIDSRVFRGRSLRASRLGRWNGIAYFVALGVPVVRDALDLVWPGDGWVRGIAWALVVTTLLSIADRARAEWRALRAGDRAGHHG